MIKLKLESLESKNGETEIEIIEGETLDSGVDRAISGIPLGDKKKEEVFQVLVNGLRVEDSGLWKTIVLKSSDMVLIAPLIEGDAGQLFKQFAILVVTVIASIYFAPAAGAGWAASVGAGLATAGVTIAATLLLNALIPPPVADNATLGGGSSVSESQMYSIRGQSNQARPYKTVPKVYGEHRMYPIVAANPYVEIETDPDTGELITYLYAVYDFGLGPCLIDDIRIGDTSIADFADVSVNLVDPNKPIVSEGPWDDNMVTDFQLYKQDVAATQLAIDLDKNRDETPVNPLDSYEAVRNAGPNPEGLEQTISLSFANQRGLFAYSNAGTIGERTIDIEIYFSKANENNWKAANDLNWVKDFSEAGGYEQYKERNLVLEAFNPLNPTAHWNFISFQQNINRQVTEAEAPGEGGTYCWGYKQSFGSLAGFPANLYLETDPEIVVGSTLKATYQPSNGFGNEKVGSLIIGKVASITNIGFGISRYTMDRPASRNFIFYEQIVLTTPNGQTVVRNPSATGKIVLERGVVGKGKISRSSTSPCFSTYKFTPIEPGEYKVRVTRVSTRSDFTAQVADSLTWTEISTRTNRAPIVTDKRHTFLEMRVRATNQLNGVIQNLSAVAISALPVYDPNTETWSRQLTSNPAWVFADLLCGEVNKKPLALNRLHLESLVEWAELCDEVPTPPSGSFYFKPRFECNFILDYDITLQGVLQQICSSAQASLNIINGKYGVLLDVLKTVPVQLFTPRNSTGFSSTRSYSRQPHAIRVKYIDSGNNWEVAEILVYDDGYDATTATEFDDLTSFACTNSEQAWRFGRYMMAQNKLRQDTISLTVDFEYLVCTRGDYVKISQDVMKVGGVPARVRAVSGNTITTDEGIETDNLLDYGYTYRAANGEIKTGTLTVVSAHEFDVDDDIPAVGNLIVIGPVDNITLDCIVKSITPADDLTAQLVLVEKADAIYDAESLDVFPEYSPKINETVNAEFRPPAEVENLAVVDNFWRCAGDMYENYIQLDWDVPIGSSFEIFEIWANDGRGYNRVDTTKKSLYEYIVDQTRLDIEHSFKVIAVSSSGKKLELPAVSAVTATPVFKTTPPSDVTFFHSDIVDQTLQLTWEKIADCDVQSYLIRYSPDVENVTWQRTVPLAFVAKNVSVASVNARTGTYMIKAVDFNGNESSEPAVIVTTVPNLFGLNHIAELTDFPVLDGTPDRIEVFSGALVLQKEIVGTFLDGKYYAEGFYEFKDFFDLEDIYTVRLQAQLRGTGLTEADLMVNWANLEDVISMSSVESSDWDVELQYRSTEQFNVMSEWVTLDSISQLNNGQEEIFTPWRKFIMGDATGRIFQFRIKLTSNKFSVTPYVDLATVLVDTPDRIENYDNLVVPNTGYTVTYDPAFLGPDPTPNVQATLQDGQTGDYLVFTGKTLEEFTVFVYDGNDVAVSGRTVDVVVKGYGRKSTSII